MTYLTPSIIKLQVSSKAAAEFVPGTGETNGQLTLSDHSRSPLAVSYDTIENTQRMADGTSRKYVIATKKTLSCAWEMLPSRKSITENSVTTELTVDSNADALSMKRFYEINFPYPMTLSLYYKRNSSTDLSYVETINVFWTTFSFDVVKRYRDFDYWNVTAEFTEI